MQNVYWSVSDLSGVVSEFLRNVGTGDSSMLKNRFISLSVVNFGGIVAISSSIETDLITPESSPGRLTVSDKDSWASS